MIEIHNLSHQIGGQSILEDVDLTIPKGGLTALIGPNGAGKSTLLNLIANQANAQTGKIAVDGHDVATTPPALLALKMALVAQHVSVASRLRVTDLIAFGRWPHCRGRLRAEDHAAIEEAITLFSLEEFRHRFLDELSGGQRQRAFIAMAFAQGTDWLLLDEPLNNLDMSHARNLMRELHTLTVERGKSVVMVVHEVNYALAWSDHVIGLKAGQVVAQGHPSEILTQSGIRDVFEMDVEITYNERSSFVIHHA